MHQKGPKSTRSSEDSRDSKLLVLIVLCAAALRLVRIDSPIGGFHAFNEANYMSIAGNFLHSSLLFPSPDGRYLFLETPPLYAYTLAGLFRLIGVSVLGARLLSVAWSLGLVIATFLLGRRLFSARAALVAALVVAVAPVAVLTGRNIQTDVQMMTLLVSAAVFFLRARDGSRADWRWFGAILGLAIFTKLVAVLLLPALLVWSLSADRSVRVFKGRGLWEALGIAAILPAVFYGYHALRDFSYVLGDVTGGAAAATRFPASATEWLVLGTEAAWAFSPFVALLLVAGAVTALSKRSSGHLFLLFPLLGFLVFYLFVHKHSYYLVTVLPFAAVLAGAFVAGLRPGSLRLGVAALAAGAGVFVSLVDLTGMKLGFTEFGEYHRIASLLPEEPRTLLVTKEIRDSYGSVLEFYDPWSRLVTLEELPRDPDGRIRVDASGPLSLLSLVPPQTLSIPTGSLLWRERFGFELFGRTLAEAHPNPHFFRQGAYIAQPTGNLLGFGFRSMRSYPAMALIPIPEGVGLYATSEGIQLRR